MPQTNRNSSRHLLSEARKGIDPDLPRAFKADANIRERPDPNVRSAKIALLQEAIAVGAYAVPAGAVAEKIVKRLIHNPEQTDPPDLRPGRSKSSN